MGNQFQFVGGTRGRWAVTRMTTICGDGLEPTGFVDVTNADPPVRPDGAAWVLRGFTSNLRYATAAEVGALRAIQPPLDRPEATCAALIPLRKSAPWWDLPQDERRAIFEETSHHTAIGLEYLPPIARRLHHCRDLGEPFDFVTWFEFAPGHAPAFDALLCRLRETREWRFVEREVEIRLRRIEP